MVTIPTQTAEVYWQILRQFSPERVKAAMLEHVKRCKFFPAVAEIGELAQKAACPHSEMRVVETEFHRREYCSECGENLVARHK